MDRAIADQHPQRKRGVLHRMPVVVHHRAPVNDKKQKKLPRLGFLIWEEGALYITFSITAPGFLQSYKYQLPFIITPFFTTIGVLCCTHAAPRDSETTALCCF